MPVKNRRRQNQWFFKSAKGNTRSLGVLRLVGTAVLLSVVDDTVKDALDLVDDLIHSFTNPDGESVDPVELLDRTILQEPSLIAPVFGPDDDINTSDVTILNEISISSPPDLSSKMDRIIDRLDEIEEKIKNFGKRESDVSAVSTFPSDYSSEKPVRSWTAADVADHILKRRLK